LLEDEDCRERRRWKDSSFGKLERAAMLEVKRVARVRWLESSMVLVR
jgi:hypothetical protein